MEKINYTLIKASEGTILLKIDKSEFGLYAKGDKRYDITCLNEIQCETSDVPLWIEVKDMNSYMAENGYVKVENNLNNIDNENN
jgi:hypothetical protein